MDCALKHTSATVKKSAGDVKSPVTGGAAAAPGLRTSHLERLWRLAFGPHMIALLDQAIVSGASFSSTVMVARWTVPSQLGIYSIGISFLVGALTIQDALVSLPYMIQRHRVAGRPEDCAGAALLQSGLLSALLVLVLAATSAGLRAGRADPDLETMVWTLAAIAPFALLREFGRRFSFAHLRLAQAALLDSAVATMQLGGLYWIGRNGWMSSATACLALGCACAPSAAMWLYLSRRDIAPRLSQLGAAIRRSWALGKWLFGSQIALLVQGYAANWLLALIAGTAMTGVYAACMSVVSISNPLMLGISNILMPRAVLALNDGGSGRLWRQSIQDAVLLGLAMAAFCVGIMIAGEKVILILYHGAAFERQGQLLTVLAAALLASSVGMPASNALASMERTRQIFWIALGAAVLTTLLVWGLTSAWGLVGAAYGFLFGNMIGAAGRWTAFSLVLWSHDPHAGAVQKTDPSLRLAQAMQVLREFAPGSATGDWSVLELDEGKQANVFVADFWGRCLDARSQGSVIIKLYKSTVASRDKLARCQFECLSRSYALLGGRTCNGWRISSPVPLHICQSPLALIMSVVPGRKLSLHLRTGGELTREIMDTVPKVVVAAMMDFWAAGRSHGDFNIDNILVDPAAREISFVDLDLPSIVLSYRDGASCWRTAPGDLAYMLYSVAMGGKSDVARPGVWARKLMFAEHVLREFVGTIAGCHDKMRLLNEIRACTQLHLRAVEVSWLPQGHWRRLLRHSAARRIDATIERLKRETVSLKLRLSPTDAPVTGRHFLHPDDCRDRHYDRRTGSAAQLSVRNRLSYDASRRSGPGDETGSVA